MNDLIHVYDASQISESKIYQINGTLYRFTGRCPWAAINHPQWTFEPLPGQRKTSTLNLNKNKVGRCVYEVPGMAANRKSQVVGGAVQQSLF